MNYYKSYSEVHKEDDDHIYYNIIIPHDNTYGSSPTLAIFDEQRVEALIDNPEDWYLSIIRFTVPGSQIPIMIVPIQSGSGQTDPNLTTMSVTLTYSTFNYQQFLEYVPTNTTISTPAPPSSNPPSYRQTQSPYYYIYVYQEFVNLINTAFNQAFTTLKTANPGITPTEAPYVIYDATTQLMSIIVPTNYVGVIDIWMNTPLQNYLTAIEKIFYGYDQPNGKDYKLNLVNNQNNAYYKQLPNSGPPAAANYYEFKQEYNVLQYLNSFRNLVFTSTLMPINNEYLPSLNALITPNQGSGLVNFIPILTDFTPLLQYAGDARSILQYYAQGPYRLVNLKGNCALRKIDLQIYWSDTYNNLHPVYISTNQQASIKILFVRRTVYRTTIK